MPSLGEQALSAAGVAYTTHPYDYRRKGAEAAAEALDIPLAAALKTLVVKLDRSRFVFLVASGDRSVSMRALARSLGARSAELASERDAERLTGYRVGGISPLGSRLALPVYVDLAALDHQRVYVNGGRRGLLLGLDPEALIGAAAAELVDVAQPR